MKPSLGRQNLCSAASCGGSDWWWVCACVLQRHTPHCLCNATAGVTTTPRRRAAQSPSCVMQGTLNRGQMWKALFGALHEHCCWARRRRGRRRYPRCREANPCCLARDGTVVTPAVAKQTPVVWHGEGTVTSAVAKQNPVVWHGDDEGIVVTPAVVWHGVLCLLNL